MYASHESKRRNDWTHSGEAELDDDKMIYRVQH